MRKTGLKQQTFSSLSLLFLLFLPLLLSLAFPIRQSFFLFRKFLHQFLQILPHFCYFCWGRIWKTEEEIFKIEKKIAVLEMQETIEEEWKAETREKEEKEGKEDVEEKSENNFINHN